MTELVTPDPTTVVEDDPKKPYKAIVAAVIAVLIVGVQAVQSALNDGSWTTEDTLTTVIAVLGAAAVYFVENPKVNARSNY